MIKNFNILLFFLLLVTVNLYSLNKEEIILKDDGIIKLDVLIFDNITKIDNYFYSYNDTSIVMFDKTGKILKIASAIGMGPGEFKRISYISSLNDSLIIYDSILKRLSIFDKNINFLNSISISTYSKNLTLYHLANNKYLVPGTFIDYSNNKINYFLFYKFKKQEEDFIFLKKLLKIDNKSLKNYNKFLLNGTNIISCKIGDKIYLLNTFLPYLYIYDIKNKILNKLSINFKDYIYPNKIKFNKIRKIKYENRRILQFLNEQYFTYFPQIIGYDDINKIFIIQFLIPFQKQIKENFNFMYETVFFDDNFDEIYSYKTNNRIFLIFRENNFLKFIERKEPNMYKDFDIEESKKNLLIKKILINRNKNK